MSTKKCHKCKLEKSLNEFHVDPHNADSLSSKCKLCACKTFKEYFEKNKEHHYKICNQDTICEGCLGTYKKRAKTLHYRTLKHKKKTEDIEKMISIENIKCSSI